MILSSALLVAVLSSQVHGPAGQGTRPSSQGQLDAKDPSLVEFDDEHLPTLAGRIGWLVDAYHERGDFNGSLLVTRDEVVLYEGHFGFQDLESRTPNSAATRYRLGSIGKQFTATAILLLKEEGALDLDDPLEVHLSDFKGRPLGRVTLRQLLHHTGGVPRSVLDYVKGGIQKRFTLEQLLAGLKSAKLEFVPGARFQYSNAGYTLLAGVVEAVSNESYNDFLRSRMFEPAGMVETHFDFPEEEIEEDALGYRASRSGKLRLDHSISMSFGIGAGTFRTTPRDMVRWDAALRGGKILSSESLEAMATPSAASGLYGFGWEVRRYERLGGTGLALTHGGGIEGFSTAIARLVDDGIVIMAMANLRFAPMQDLVAEIQALILQEGDSGENSGVNRVQLALVNGGPGAAEVALAKMCRNERGVLGTAAQLCGPHDAVSRSSYGRCWFPADRGGKDTLELEFEGVLQAVMVEIHGTNRQRGLTDLSLRDVATGQWSTVKLDGVAPSGSATYSDGLGMVAFALDGGERIDGVRLEIDHGLLEGSNTVDAVALVAADGSREWAVRAKATSDRGAEAVALVLDPPTPNALVLRARRLREACFLEDALVLADFNATRTPDSWRAFACLARCAVAAGDVERARTSFGNALALQPSDPAERRALKKELRELKSEF